MPISSSPLRSDVRKLLKDNGYKFSEPDKEGRLIFSLRTGWMPLTFRMLQMISDNVEPSYSVEITAERSRVEIELVKK